VTEDAESVGYTAMYNCFTEKQN